MLLRVDNRFVEYTIGARANTTASDMFYDLLATTGMMILGVRKRCISSNASYVYVFVVIAVSCRIAIPPKDYIFQKEDIVICILPDLSN